MFVLQCVFIQCIYSFLYHSVFFGHGCKVSVLLWMELQGGLAPISGEFCCVVCENVDGIIRHPGHQQSELRIEWMCIQGS